MKLHKSILIAGMLLFSVALSAQMRTVKGTVTYGDVPITGLKVLVAGSERTTFTDGKGHYSIELSPEENTLLFSGDGIISAYVKVKKKIRGNVDVKLQVSDFDVAYAKGLLDKKMISNSKTFIDPERKISGELSMKNIIEGSSAGVRYLDGAVFIRGDKCLLYLVDGARVNDLSNIDPGTVEKVEIVKDGTGNLYGAASVNGVVLITTKASGTSNLL